MKKKNTRKLNLSKETLTTLEAKNLAVAGGAAVGCQESRLVCSIQHTCVSCRPSDDTLCA
jgi:hypothetical protein